MSRPETGCMKFGRDSYDKVYESIIKYFDGDESAAKVFVDKYALRKDDGSLENPADMHRRIARELDRIEKNKFSKD